MTYFKSAVFGLIKAIDNFDISQDVQFSTYRSSNDMPLGEKNTYKAVKLLVEVDFIHFYFL